MPRLIDADAGSRTLMLEDLGEARDFSEIYAGGTLTRPEVDALATYLSRLHSRFDASALGTAFTNRDMRELNHLHIFDLPLNADNGLDLDRITQGLAARAEELRRDHAYVDAVSALGVRYLRDGESLLHGDYFPGSWLRTPTGVKVIDPEFCFFGSREFDIGVMLAHLVLAEQPDALAIRLADTYGRAGFDRAVAIQFAGVEIMRRLIGVAQLPLRSGLREKTARLAGSRRMVLDPRSQGTP